MIVERYIPRREKLWEHRDDGVFKAHIYTELGIVEFFTFSGDDRQRAFTKVTMYLHPHVYHRTLARHYHHRWARRLARDFAYSCKAMSEGRIRG